MGFCFGVRRAVDLARAQAVRPVYTYGKLIHNETVVAELAGEGIFAVEDLSSLQSGDTLIIRAHGAPPVIFSDCAARGVTVVDATCPFVRRIHRIVEDAQARVFIAGKAAHPEVIGIRSRAGEDCVVLESAADAMAVQGCESAVLVSQTTLRGELFTEIMAALRTRVRALTVHNTICDTTAARQAEAASIAKRCTRVFVLGSQFSANSAALAQICLQYCKNTQIINSFSKINLAILRADDIIGIVAGASTPDCMILEVTQGMSEATNTTIEPLDAEAPAEGIVEEPTNPTPDAEPVEEIPAAEPAELIEESIVESIEEAVAVGADSIRPPEETAEEAVVEAVEEAVPEVAPETIVEVEPIEEAAAELAEPAEPAESVGADSIRPPEEEEAAEEAEPAEDPAPAPAKPDAPPAKSEFESAFEKTMRRIRPGQVIVGTVLQIVDGEVFVNIGYKCDGVIPRGEYTADAAADVNELVKVGDQVDVEVVKVNDGEGNVLLSSKALGGKQLWDELLADDVGTRLYEVRVKESVKGGLLADLQGIRVFIPASHVPAKKEEKFDEFVGKTLSIKVLEADRKKRRIVASARAARREEAANARREKMEALEIGAKVHGIVRRITDFGAFVDIGGIDGLVHVTDAGWGRVRHTSDILAVNQEVEVLIKEVDVEKGRISLGYKQLQPKPWTRAGETYVIGSIVEGKVVRIVPFGAFVALESTIDGLIHISQVAARRVEKVEDELQVGDIVRAKVLEVNPEAKRISLSRRDALLEENPDLAEQIRAEREEADRLYQERRERREQREQRDAMRSESQQPQQREQREQRRPRPEGAPRRSDAPAGEPRERRRRDDADYELPTATQTTTSLADLFAGFKVEE